MWKQIKESKDFDPINNSLHYQIMKLSEHLEEYKALKKGASFINRYGKTSYTITSIHLKDFKKRLKNLENRVNYRIKKYLSMKEASKRKNYVLSNSENVEKLYDAIEAYEKAKEAFDKIMRK